MVCLETDSRAEGTSLVCATALFLCLLCTSSTRHIANITLCRSTFPNLPAMVAIEDFDPIVVEAPASSIVHTRAYQQELLEESKRRNIVIALDTGSGKTHIAVLRMKYEAERESRKVHDIMSVCDVRPIDPPLRFRGS